MNLPDAAFHLVYTTASPPPKEAAGASLTCRIKFILIKTKPQKQEEERAGGHGSPLVPPDPAARAPQVCSPSHQHLLLQRRREATLGLPPALCSAPPRPSAPGLASLWPQSGPRLLPSPQRPASHGHLAKPHAPLRNWFKLATGSKVVSLCPPSLGRCLSPLELGGHQRSASGDLRERRTGKVRREAPRQGQVGAKRGLRGQGSALKHQVKVSAKVRKRSRTQIPFLTHETVQKESRETATETSKCIRRRRLAS